MKNIVLLDEASITIIKNILMRLPTYHEIKITIILCFANIIANCLGIWMAYVQTE